MPQILPVLNQRYGCLILLQHQGKAFPDIGGKKGDANEGSEATSKATGQKEGTGGGAGGGGPGGDRKMPGGQEMVGWVFDVAAACVFLFCAFCVWDRVLSRTGREKEGCVVHAGFAKWGMRKRS